MNSEAIKAKTHSDIAKTPPQCAGRRSRTSGAGTFFLLMTDVVEFIAFIKPGGQRSSESPAGTGYGSTPYCRTVDGVGTPRRRLFWSSGGWGL